jgi:VanZ family protein
MLHSTSHSDSLSWTSLLNEQRCGIAAFVFFIVILTSSPFIETQLHAFIDNASICFISYFLLAILIYRSLAITPIPRWIRTLIFIGLLAFLDETLHLFVGYRNIDLHNWTVDMAACVAALLFTAFIAKIRSSSEGNQ